MGVAYIETPDLNEPNEVWIAGRLDLGDAWLPMPYDGAVDILRDVSLSWQPGDYVQATNGHKVYFADNFTDVNSRAALVSTQTDTTYDAGQLETLELAKTYYWAIDEVNGATTWPGPVWSFTMDRGVAKNPDPLDGAEYVNSLGVTLSWAPGLDANDVNGHEVYFGTSWGDVNDANTATAVIYRGPDDVLGPDGNDRYSYVIPGGDLPFALGEPYYWRIDEVNGTNTWKGDVWSFEVEGKAKVVYPADGAGNIPALNLLLRWEAGTGAAGHDVYFGTSQADVENATTASDPNLFRGTQALSDVNYPVEDLEAGEPHFWRIDEVNTISGTLVTGDVWSFTTGVYLLVDSFEPYRYVDTGDLTAVWTDPLANVKNDAQLKLFFAFADSNKVYAGEQSMEFAYRCFQAAQGKYIGSWAAADMPTEVGTDWTVAGVKALVVNFYGDEENAYDHNSGYEYDITEDQMYVELEDNGANTGLVKLPSMSGVKTESWQTWNISLIDPNFSSVDMNNVTKVYIGFGGDKAGQGKAGAGQKSGSFDTVWFDDIRLYPPRCMPETTGLDVLHALGDFTEDCNTDYLDLDIMAEDWMKIDGDVLTENRPAVLTDFVGEPNWTTDCAVGTGALEVNNVEGQDKIDVTDPRLAGLTNMTITAWIKRNGTQQGYCGIVASREVGGWATELMGNGNKTDEIAYGWNGNYWSWKSGLTPPDQTWTFIAVAVEPTQATMYMHPAGGSMSSNSNVDDHERLTYFSEQFRIARSNPEDKKFKGLIDDIRIYDWTLDEPNMLKLSTKTGEPNKWPVYWYKFDDGAGTVAADSGFGTQVYSVNTSVANLVPKDPCDSEDPNLASGAFDPNNMDIINFLDYRVMAENWLSGPWLWPLW